MFHGSLVPCAERRIINMQNNTDTDKIVYVEIEGVEVRIE